MTIVLDIPYEFEKDYKTNRFIDCLERFIADTKDRVSTKNILCAGNYEIETAKMLIKAFLNSKEQADIYDQNKASEMMIRAFKEI